MAIFVVVALIAADADVEISIAGRRGIKSGLTHPSE
jgi:hypothetical protein